MNAHSGIGLLESDLALIARAATRIGRSVTIERIEGAIHDVFLSAPASRDAAYTALERWLLQGALAR